MGNRGQIEKLILALWLCLFAGWASAEDCRPDTVYLRGEFGQARFAVELADTAQERAIGLMNRESMPKSAGMLFLYPYPQRVGFWMRNTLIPLDMLFLDDTGTVRRVHHMAKPLDETLIDGGRGISAVLEINGGLARLMGITEGAQMRHPGFSNDRAAWPC